MNSVYSNRNDSLGVHSSRNDSLGVPGSRNDSLGVHSSRNDSLGVHSSRNDSLGVHSSRNDSLIVHSCRDSLVVPDEQLTHAIIGVAIEVHRHLGPGLLESIYERAMQIELGRRELPYRAQVPVPMTYKSEPVGDFYADLIIADRVIVELKAVSALHNAHITQLLGYLAATRLHLGLLINFNVPLLVKGVKRVIRSGS